MYLVAMLDETPSRTATSAWLNPSALLSSSASPGARRQFIQRTLENLILLPGFEIAVRCRARIRGLQCIIQ